LQNPCEGGISRFMLPGFRFLFAAIVLSMSILVFGLGAAALLRAAHEEFASTPAWHATPETMFAQQNEATRPVLALLRVEPPAEQKAPNNVPPETVPPVIAPAPAEPEKIAALGPEDSAQPAAAKPEVPVSPISPPIATVSAPADAPASIGETQAAAAVTSAPADPPASADATKVAAIEEVASPAGEAASSVAAPEQASALVAPEADSASTKIATLGGPPVTIERPAPAAPANTDKADAKKRQQAQRTKARRRMAQRARLTAQLPQQPADPFAQPQAPVRSR
jgi:hypothetical protein